MDSSTVAGGSVSELGVILDSPEIRALVENLEETRWTGRPGYRVRSQIGMLLVKHLYCIPVWSRTIRLVEEHDALWRTIGCTGTGEPDGVPSEDALLRFRRKVMDHHDLLTVCFDRILASLKRTPPRYGRKHSHRRLRPTCLRQRPQDRKPWRARAVRRRVQRPRCFLGTPVGNLNGGQRAEVSTGTSCTPLWTPRRISPSRGI